MLPHSSHTDRAHALPVFFVSGVLMPDDLEQFAIILGGDGCDLDDIDCECGVKFYAACDVCESMQEWQKFCDTQGESGVPDGCWKCGDGFGRELTFSEAVQQAHEGQHFIALHMSVFDPTEDDDDEDDEGDAPWRAFART